ncbi:MAG: hypothetical protein R2932_28395 [Caldilineaceae bacterium]
MKLGDQHHDLHAPVLVEQAREHNMFWAEPTVRESMVGRAVKLARIGIGAVVDVTVDRPYRQLAAIEKLPYGKAAFRSSRVIVSCND